MVRSRDRPAIHHDMDVVLSICAFLLAILGIAGCIVPALPGTLLSYGGLLCAYFTSYSQMSASALWIWLAICIAVSVADYVLPAWMTKRFGGSRAGSIGATVGVFVGFFFLPPIGIILGPFLGAVIGELINNRNERPKPCLSDSGRSSRSSSEQASSSSPRSAFSSTSLPTPSQPSKSGSQRHFPTFNHNCP